MIRFGDRFRMTIKASLGNSAEYPRFSSNILKVCIASLSVFTKDLSTYRTGMCLALLCLL